MLPIATASAFLPCASNSFSFEVTARNTLVFRPPHRPLSVVTTMKPTVFAPVFWTMNGCLYSGVACDRLAARLRIFSA